MAKPETDPGLKPDFNKGNGLIPVITQEYGTNEVLMLAYMNKESFKETLLSGRATYFSRSRNKLWYKGEESGNTQQVKSMYIDCDGDVVLLRIEQKGGAACHTGRRSCFYRKLEDGGDYQVVSEPLFDPKEVYKK